MPTQTWWTARAGSWDDPEMPEYFGGTYYRDKMFKEAQEVANKKGVRVTVYGDNTKKTYTFDPEPKPTEMPGRETKNDRYRESNRLPGQRQKGPQRYNRNRNERRG